VPRIVALVIGPQGHHAGATMHMEEAAKAHAAHPDAKK
jgi:hypothetical protein